MKPKRTTREKAAAVAAGAEQPAIGQPVEEKAQARATNGAASLISTDQEEIARLAYHLWEARGGQGGSAEDDWLRAEQEYRKRREASTR